MEPEKPTTELTTEPPTTNTGYLFEQIIPPSSASRWNFCPEDGTKLDPTWAYCPKCGKLIGSMALPYWLVYPYPYYPTVPIQPFYIPPIIYPSQP